MDPTNKLEELYEHYNKLDSSKENIKQFESSYAAILSAVSGTSQEKQLCSQFISKFFVHFPEHYETAIDALLDLCEDDDPNIRRRAIKELPNICRDRKEFVNKIADALAQILLSDDQVELNIVNQALITLSSYDIKSFFRALFGQILEGEEETRDRVIKFLNTKFNIISSKSFDKEIEEFFLEECKKVLVDVTKQEFIIMMNLLSSLKISKTLNGHNSLINIIKEQAELDLDFIPSDGDFLDKFLMCTRHGIPFFSQFSPSTEFVLYICFKILPHFNFLETQQNSVELEVLQVLAEIIAFLSPTIDQAEIEKCQDVVFNILLKYTPKPSENLDSISSVSDDLPGTQFSHIECLLYSFHQLNKLNPNYFSESRAQVLKDFKIRLQYLARGVQTYINKLKKVISSLKPDELKNPDNNIKVVALKATTNISNLIKDFFKIPPAYKTVIILSFKNSKNFPINMAMLSNQSIDSADSNLKKVDQSETIVNLKRKPITAPEGNSATKTERKFYTPPAGKFSGNFKTNSRFKFFRNNSERFNFSEGRKKRFKKF